MSSKKKDSQDYSEFNIDVDVDMEAVMREATMALNSTSADHVEITEADLQDGDLLGELRELGGSDLELSDLQDDMKSSAGAPAPNKPDESAEKRVDDHVFAEDEMDEAERLRRMMSGEDVPMEGGILEEPLKEPKKEYVLQEHNAEEINEKIKKQKMRAIELKRAGKHKEALEALKLKKVLEGELRKLDGKQGSGPSSGGVGASQESNSIASQEEAKKPVPAPRPACIPAPSVPASAVAPTPSAAAASPHSALNGVQQQITIVKARREEYKAKAIAFRKANDRENAKRMLIVCKTIDPLLEQLNMGMTVDLKDLPPSPAEDEERSSTSTPPRTLPPATGRTAANAASSPRTPTTSGANTKDPINSVKSDSGRCSGAFSSDYDSVFKKIIGTSEDQVNLCLSQAKKFMKDGDKTTALKYFKLKKSFEQDLESLQSSYTAHGPIPRFHYQDNKIEVVRHFPLIAEEDLEIFISEVCGVKPPPKYKESDMELFICGSFNYPQSGAQEFQTDTVKKTCNPSFNFTQVCPIDRKKSFQRFTKKSACFTFDLYQKGGFLRKSILLGSCKMGLDDLSSKCEMTEDLDFYDSKKKAVGARLSVRIRLREPLVERDVTFTTHSFLAIDDFNPSASSSRRSSVGGPTEETLPIPLIPQTPTDVVKDDGLQVTAVKPAEHAIHVQPPDPVSDENQLPGEKREQTHSEMLSPAEPKTPVASPVASNKGTPAKASPVPSPRSAGTSPKLPVDDELEEPGIDEVVSNMVLEMEQQQVEKQILQYQRAKKVVPEELTDKKSQIDIKMTMLILQVQNGTLSMEGYLDLLRKRIPIDKKLAIDYKKAGKLEWSKIALTRYQVMKDELSEAEAAMNG